MLVLLSDAEDVVASPLVSDVALSLSDVLVVLLSLLEERLLSETIDDVDELTLL